MKTFFVNLLQIYQCIYYKYNSKTKKKKKQISMDN